MEGSINVVAASKKRLINIFNNGLPVFFGFSGGKDSLTLAQLIMELIQEGKINPKQLQVYFLDEEAIYDCIEKICLKWRKKFLMAGASFDWYCIECKHFNCFNNLQNDESFICWDSTKKDLWVRQPPSFAIREHPLLEKREETYQMFFKKILINGISILGVRASESLQRLQNFARTKSVNNGMNYEYKTFPIYDWRDADVWRYLREHNVEIPEVYMYLWQSGISKRNLRISQFFSIDTARCLVKMNEYYPTLMEKVVRREPNAYLAALYWDSEMFGRNGKTRAEIEKNEKPKDYKSLLINMFNNMHDYFPNEHAYSVAENYRALFIKFHNTLTYWLMEEIYEALLSGDPKKRKLRALYTKCSMNVIKLSQGYDAEKRSDIK